MNPQARSYVYPIEDPINVDERRSKVGLEPLVEYLKGWGIDWDPKKHEDENSKKVENR
jgi:hypothetical protein